MEIEKKFSIKDRFIDRILRAKQLTDVTRTATWYLKDSQSLYETRLRARFDHEKVDFNNAEITIKSKFNRLVRTEWTFTNISVNIIEEFIQKSYQPIYCERFMFDSIYDIHIVDFEAHNPIIYAEVEFQSQLSAEQFVPSEIVDKQIDFYLYDYVVHREG